MRLELFYGRSAPDQPFDHLDHEAGCVAFDCAGVVYTFNTIEVVFNWGDAHINNEHRRASEAMAYARSLTGWDLGLRDYGLIMRRAEGDDSDMIVATNSLTGQTLYFSDFSLED